MEATPSPDELDERALLSALAEHRDVVALAEVEQVEWVHRWAIAHPALGEQVPGVVGVLRADERPGGDGTPGVAAFTAEPLAGALRISPTSAQALLADTLDLVHRLPRLWDHVRALAVPVWKARRIARATRGLALESARWVDRQLIGEAASLGPAALDRLVATAVARADTRGQAEREAAERARWDVTIAHPRDWAGTSEVTAVGDTRLLTELVDLVRGEADALSGAGDTDPAGARRVKALVSLVRHGADQLVMGFEIEQAATGKGRGSQGPGNQGRAGEGSVRLYLHADLADVTAAGAGSTSGCTETAAIGQVERFGPATLTLLKEWVGHSRVTIVPVLDLAAAPWSPRHDPPPRMREQVLLRHPGCVFPFCGRDARGGDLDHVVPWHPDEPDEPGSVAGTRPDNLAPLCRRHHRAKTDGRWRYESRALGVDDPPDHLWSGPQGQMFLVRCGRTVSFGL